MTGSFPLWIVYFENFPVYYQHKSIFKKAQVCFELESIPFFSLKRLRFINQIFIDWNIHKELKWQRLMWHAIDDNWQSIVRTKLEWRFLISSLHYSKIQILRLLSVKQATLTRKLYIVCLFSFSYEKLFFKLPYTSWLTSVCYSRSISFNTCTISKRSVGVGSSISLIAPFSQKKSKINRDNNNGWLSAKKRSYSWLIRNRKLIGKEAKI